MNEPIVLTLKCAHGQKTWVALIRGRDRVYGLARDFVKATVKTSDSADYIVEPGIYDVCEAGRRYFVEVKDDKAKEIDKDAVYQELIARTQRRKKKKAKHDHEIDNMIARINNEGGFTMTPPNSPEAN